MFNLLALCARVKSTQRVLAASLLVGLGSLPARGTEGPSAQGGTVLVAPGPDAPKVIEFLERILDGRREADRPLTNLIVHGRFSRVDRAWSAGIADQNPETMPEPQWCKFMVVHKDRKRRSEREYYRHADGKSEKIVLYRLMDNEGFYKLDGTTLDITELADVEDRWADLEGTFLYFEQIFDGTEYVPMEIGLQHLIDQLSGKVEGDVWNADERLLRCREDKGLLIVEKFEGPAVPKSRSGYTFSFTVDPGKGYRLVKRTRTAGGSGRGLYYREVVSLEIAEIGPKVFLPKSATSFTSTLGTIDRQDGAASWWKKDLEVTDVKFGDFDYDAKLFDWKSLPIPSGAHVEDRRVSRKGSRKGNIQE